MSEKKPLNLWPYVLPVLIGGVLALTVVFAVMSHRLKKHVNAINQLTAEHIREVNGQLKKQDEVLEILKEIEQIIRNQPFAERVEMWGLFMEFGGEPPEQIVAVVQESCPECDMDTKIGDQNMGCMVCLWDTFDELEKTKTACPMCEVTGAFEDQTEDCIECIERYHENLPDKAAEPRNEEEGK
jgi:hypothetical protein